MIRKTTTFLFTLLALVLTFAPVALAQDYGQGADGEAWKPKENFWWLFAAYAVIWIGVFGYVAKMAGKQQELERELKRLEQGETN